MWLWLYALFFALIGVSGRRLGAVDPILWSLPIVLLFFMGLGLRMHSKLVTLLYIAGTSVAVLWMVIEYLLSPLPVMLMGLAFTASVYVPTAGMIIHWSRLRW